MSENVRTRVARYLHDGFCRSIVRLLFPYTEATLPTGKEKRRRDLSNPQSQELFPASFGKTLPPSKPMQLMVGTSKLLKPIRSWLTLKGVLNECLLCRTRLEFQRFHTFCPQKRESFLRTFRSLRLSAAFEIAHWQDYNLRAALRIISQDRVFQLCSKMLYIYIPTLTEVRPQNCNLLLPSSTLLGRGHVATPQEDSVSLWHLQIGTTQKQDQTPPDPPRPSTLGCRAHWHILSQQVSSDINHLLLPRREIYIYMYIYSTVCIYIIIYIHI